MVNTLAIRGILYVVMLARCLDRYIRGCYLSTKCSCWFGIVAQKQRLLRCLSVNIEQTFA